MKFFIADIEVGFLPWLMNEVEKTMEHSMVGRTMLDSKLFDIKAVSKLVGGEGTFVVVVVLTLGLSVVLTRVQAPPLLSWVSNHVIPSVVALYLLSKEAKDVTCPMH